MLSFTAPKGLIALYFGVSGCATVYSYFVQAIFPEGRSAWSGPAQVTAPASFSSQNVVQFGWNPVPGAIGYDVVRNTTGTTPVGSGNTAVAVNETSSQITDNGTVALSYTCFAQGGLVQASAIGTATLTTDLCVNEITVLTGIPVAAATYTLPTAAAIIAAMDRPNLANYGCRLLVYNRSGGLNTITIAVNTGVTAVGTTTLTIAQNNFREFFLIPTNIGTPAVSLLGGASGAF